MNKLLLYAATMVSLAACSEATFDELDPEVGGHEVAVSVSAEESADTRVSYDEDWAVTWDEGDALLAVAQNYMTSSKFTMSTYDATNPTFTGDAPAGSNKYCLLYPQSLLDAQMTNINNFVLDLTQQSAGAKHTYMCARDISSSDTEPSVEMKHLGATMVLDMKFTGYDDYTIERLEISGLTSCTTYNGSDGSFIDSKANTITITDGATKIESSAEGIAKVRFNILPTTIANGGTVRVNAYLKNDEGTTAALTKTITNETGDPIAFDRAKYHTLKCGFRDSDVIDYDTKWTDEGNYSTEEFEGSGSEDAPYEISTAKQLAKLAKDVGNNGNTYEDKFFKLTKDIDLSGHEWVVIGNSSTKFKGIFDGDGHSVTWLYINQPSSFRQALFGCVAEATIKNLSVSGSVTGKDYVGGVVGRADYTSITNCYNNSSVEGGVMASVGGVVGRADYTSITNCYNNGSVEGGEMAAVGGVVGFADDASITNSYNNGSLEGGDEAYVGGVAGCTETITITNCYNNGSVNGGGNAYVGGVDGSARNRGTITNCYNNGSVEGGEMSTVGGVAGEALYITITNCYNNSSLKGGSGRTGGVVGVADDDSKVTHCYYTNGDLNSVGAGDCFQYGCYAKEISEMQREIFKKMLNYNATAYNNKSPSIKACGWVVGANDYPILNFGVMP